MTQSPTERNPEQDAFEKLAFDTLAELTQIHGELHPEKETSHFLGIFKSLCMDPSVNGDEAIAQLERAQDEGKKAPYIETALVVSSAYLAEARQEADRDRIGRAWYALAKACYWCGVMRSVNDKIDFTRQAVDAIRKVESGVGGKMRAAKYAEAKKQVIELAHDFRPLEGWDSRREAALAIMSHLNDLIPENPIREVFSDLSPDRWERTFSDWLGEELTGAQFKHLFPDSELPKRLLDKPQQPR